MAKGNDGNYFQHGIEVALATKLLAAHPNRHLHVAFAHGMAPFEECETSRPGQARSLLVRALSDSYRPAQPREPAVVTAYRATNARFEEYPNSAELMRKLVGTAKLSGGITEMDSDKHRQLADAWAGTRIEVMHSSWRAAIRDKGILTCPESLNTPWLFTLDPMTYREVGEADDNNVYRSDLDELASALRRYAHSGQPGVAALFVYAIKPDDRPSFWRFSDDLATGIGASGLSCWHTHQGGNRNLAILLSAQFDLEQVVLPLGITVGRD